jgi:hypothetical protein
MSKQDTLGKVAWDAYAAAHGGMRQWDTVGLREQQAWEAAANEVAFVAIKELLVGMKKKAMKKPLGKAKKPK